MYINYCKNISVNIGEKGIIDFSQHRQISPPFSNHELYLVPLNNQENDRFHVETSALPGYDSLTVFKLSDVVDAHSLRLDKENPLFSSNKQHKDDNNTESFHSHALTPEAIVEIKAIQLRGVTNPKIFFKKVDLQKIPDKFQLGTYVNTNYNITNENIIPRTKKPKSIISSLLKDTVVDNFTKKKARQIWSVCKLGSKSWYRHQILKRRSRIN